MNPRDPLRPSLFRGPTALGVLFLAGFQQAAAAGIASTSPDMPVAFMAGTLATFFGILSFGVFLLVMTALFSLLVGSVQTRKNRFIILEILLILIIAKDLLLLSGPVQNFYGPFGYVTLLLNFIGICKFPLVIILAGMLWFWPGDQISWKDSVFCSAIVFILGATGWGILAHTGILPRLYGLMNDGAHSAPFKPEVFGIIFFAYSILTLMLLFLLAWTGFRIIAAYRERCR